MARNKKIIPKSRVDLRTHHRLLYYFLLHNNKDILDKYFPTIKKRKLKGYWTKTQCLMEGKKYETKGEWRAANYSSYKAASRGGWMDECCLHMTKNNHPKGYWNIKNNCIEDARKYKNISEWRKHSDCSYRSAKKNGWFDECTKHMEYHKKYHK